MVKRLTVTLEPLEFSGLLEIAIGELRSPADQLRMILRQELERRGLQTATRETDEIDTEAHSVEEVEHG